MNKKILGFIFAICLIIPFSLLLTACEFGGGNKQPTFTVTAPVNNDNVFVAIASANGFADNLVSEDGTQQIAKLYEGSKVSLHIYFSDDFYYRYNISNNVEVKLNDKIVDLPELKLINNFGKYGYSFEIEAAISQNHIITIDTSNVVLKTITYNMELKLNDLSLYVVNNEKANGCESTDDVFNNRFEVLRNNWSFKYKLESETTWTSVPLTSVVDANSLTVPFTLNLTVDQNSEEINFKIRYGNNYEFSMLSNDIFKLGSNKIASVKNHMDKVEYDEDGYASYNINTWNTLSESQTNTFTLSSPTERRKFVLNYHNDYRSIYYLMKTSYNEANYYSYTLDNMEDLFNDELVNVANHFIGQTIEFKGAKGYTNIVHSGTIKRYCFDEFCDYSNAKLYCKDTALTANEDGIYSFTFDASLIENDEFNFSFRGLEANSNGAVVKFIKDNSFQSPVDVDHCVEKEDPNGYLVQLNFFPRYGEDCVIVPEKMLLKTIVARDKQFSGSFNVIINGDRVASMQTSTITDGSSGDLLSPLLTLDLSEVANKTDCDYIEITYEAVAD